MAKMLAAVLHNFNRLVLEEVPCPRHLRLRLQGHHRLAQKCDFSLHPWPRAKRHRS